MILNHKQKIITAESGQNVTLTCRAADNNIVAVKWSRADLESEYVLYYRGKQLDPDKQHPSFKNRVDLQERLMKDGDVSLILKNVTTNDTGTYECRVAQRGPNQQRANLELRNTITLRVSAPPGPTGGTSEDGGSAGLIVGLIVSALLLLLVAAAGFWIYRKSKEQKQDPYEPPAELQPL